MAIGVSGPSEDLDADQWIGSGPTTNDRGQIAIDVRVSGYALLFENMHAIGWGNTITSPP